MTFTYPAVFRKNNDGSYDGYFPDLDGCTFSGINIDEAINAAIAAEKEWIEVELEEEIGLPFLTDPQDIILKENESVHTITAIMHLQDGFDS